LEEEDRDDSESWQAAGGLEPRGCLGVLSRELGALGKKTLDRNVDHFFKTLRWPGWTVRQVNAP